jgi:SAM-dependent methyltransferase
LVPEEAGRRFARLATRATVARPWAWRVFRPLVRSLFDRLSAGWEDRLGPEALAALAAALERLDGPPRRALDLGTGTGKAARLIAGRFAGVEVVGADLAPGMIDEARRALPDELAGRVRFEVADAAALPYEDAGFDLVVLLNMIPFFEELARVTAPGGTLVVASSGGPQTPIYVPPETLRERLGGLGFGDFEEVAAGSGTALLARLSRP